MFLFLIFAPPPPKWQHHPCFYFALQQQQQGAGGDLGEFYSHSKDLERDIVKFPTLLISPSLYTFNRIWPILWDFVSSSISRKRSTWIRAVNHYQNFFYSASTLEQHEPDNAGRKLAVESPNQSSYIESSSSSEGASETSSSHRAAGSSIRATTQNKKNHHIPSLEAKKQTTVQFLITISACLCLSLSHSI